MKPGLLDALRAAVQTGQLPEHGAAPAPVADAPPLSFHEQLVGSLATGQALQGHTSLGERANRARFPSRSAKQYVAGPSDGSKGGGTGGQSLAEALGLEAPGVQVADPTIEASLAGPAAVSDTTPLRLSSDLQPAPTGPITYDLPVDPDKLPASCYVAGPAGTGKTWWLKAVQAFDPDGCVLAATTGIAAVNLGEGTTINALLKYYNTASLRDAFVGGWLEGSIAKLRSAGIRRILLDEVSMMDGDQLTILARAIDNVNAQRKEDMPEFGLILGGDFAQLPPVGVDRKAGGTGSRGDETAIFAFESPEWSRYADHTFRLTTIRRQADRAFIEALQACRRGDAGYVAEFFGPLMQATTDDHFDGPTILAKNESVEKYNQLRLDRVPGQIIEFRAVRWGELRKDWGGPGGDPKKWNIPELLRLKVGALVMVLANKNDAEQGAAMPEYRYVNGDLGYIVDVSGGQPRVKLQRTGQDVTVEYVRRENVIPLEPGRRKELRAQGTPERIDAKGRYEITGTIDYMPLRLAYATTVHKSQGLSLDQVQVNIKDSFFSSPGMLYVALSRARTLAGLRLVGSPALLKARCTVSPKVRPWL